VETKTSTIHRFETLYDYRPQDSAHPGLFWGSATADACQKVLRLSVRTKKDWYRRNPAGSTTAGPGIKRGLSRSGVYESARSPKAPASPHRVQPAVAAKPHCLKQRSRSGVAKRTSNSEKRRDILRFALGDSLHRHPTSVPFPFRLERIRGLIRHRRT